MFPSLSQYDFAHHEDIFADDLVAGGAEEIIPVNEIVNQEVILVIDENAQAEAQPEEALVRVVCSFV